MITNPFIYKLSAFLLNVNQVYSQLMGSQQDDNGCYQDGGYQWCDSLSECIRPWEQVCNPVIPNNCASWFDGCNTCDVLSDGTLYTCTLMYCVSETQPECLSYYVSDQGH